MNKTAVAVVACVVMAALIGLGGIHNPGKLGVAYACGKYEGEVGKPLLYSWCQESRDIYLKQVGP